MKQKDYLTVLAAVIFSIIVSMIVANVLFSFKAKPQSVPVVESISANFPTPSNSIFNSNALDPTKLITIGNNSNTLQFNSH